MVNLLYCRQFPRKFTVKAKVLIRVGTHVLSFLRSAWERIPDALRRAPAPAFGHCRSVKFTVVKS
jgi:hypothetical protein